MAVRARILRIAIISFSNQISLLKMVQERAGSSVKTFILENQNTYQSQNMQVLLPLGADSVDIRHTLDSFKEKHSIFMPLEWKIYDPKVFAFKTINIEKPLNSLYFYSPVVMLKYKELPPLDSDSESLNSKASSETKKERNKERTIKEVIEYVKQWRQVHNRLDKYKNKINLYDAAKVVGIAKKSLDDYFCQLRLAEEYGFNFEENINQKIGVLRSYVKKNRPKGDQSVKHERLPKKLRVIEDYGMEVTLDRKQSEQKVEMIEQQPFESLIQSQYEPPLGSILEDELENKFFNSFNFMIDDPNDPFILPGYTGSTSGTNESQSAHLFFF